MNIFILINPSFVKYFEPIISSLKDVYLPNNQIFVTDTLSNNFTGLKSPYKIIILNNIHSFSPKRNNRKILFQQFNEIMKSNSKYIIYETEPIVNNKKILRTYQEYKNVNALTNLQKTLYSSEDTTLTKILINNCEEIWTYSKQNCNILKSYNKAICWVPPLYSEEIDYRINPSKIDTSSIVFIGGADIPYRKAILKMFKDDNINVIMVKDKFNEELKEIYRRYTYFLNIHKSEGSQLEYFRISPILTNGGVVISEKSDKSDMKFFKGTNIYFYQKKKLLKGFLKIKKIINPDLMKRRNNYFKENFHLRKIINETLL
jgi:hypothetical protein